MVLNEIELSGVSVKPRITGDRERKTMKVAGVDS